MTKPATKPVWATDLTNNTAPSAGQQATGWTVGQTGVSSYANWLGYWTYQWIDYFDTRFFQTQTRNIPGSAFVNGINVVAGGNGRTLTFSGAAGVYYPLHLNVGDTLGTVNWSYTVGATGTVFLHLVRGLLDTSDALSTVTPVSGSETDATGTVQEFSLVTYNHVIAANYVYFLSFTCNDATSQLHGAALTWTAGQ